VTKLTSLQDYQEFTNGSLSLATITAIVGRHSIYI